MKNSMFEDILNSKAKSYKPCVNPNIYSGVKAGLNAGIKTGLATSGKAGVLKAIVAKVSYPIIVKTVIGVASVTSIVTTSYLLTSDDKNDEQILLVENQSEIDNKISTITFDFVENNKQLLENSDCACELIPCDKSIVNYSDYDNVNKSKQYVHVNEIDQRESIFSLSYDQFDLETTSSKFQDIKEEKKRKIQLGVQASYGTLFLLNNNNSNEKNKGSSYGIGLLAMYQLSSKISLGVITSFYDLQVITEYYSNGQKDGELQQDFRLITCNLNVGYKFLEREKWYLSSMLGGGISYKLKHKNSLSGKYFQNDFSYDHNKKNVISYNVNLALNYHLRIKSNMILKAGLQTKFYNLHRNQLLDCSGLIGITYHW